MSNQGTASEIPRLGRFSIRRTLGQGGMGVVYEAYDQELGALVALKTLRRVSPQALYLFKNEFRALSDLHHPNLVQLYELFYEDGLYFFTMELLQGQDFLSYVRNAPQEEEIGETTEGAAPPSQGESPKALAGQLHEERLRGALRQLAQGLSALHAAAKIHRDVKPSNVLITEEGRLVLLDFGLVVEEGQEDRMILGTPHYMAPEQAAGAPLSPRSDWYSVGVMLYQALTGVLPFSGSLLQVMQGKQVQEPPAPSQRAPSVPKDLDALCARLLRRAPGERPSDEELCEQLGVTAPSFLPTAPFVGRAAELSLLRGAFEESLKGQALACFIEGETGLGKTALCRHFVEGVPQEKGALVLTGRCYERESVPYKALDGVVDSLLKYLRSVPNAERSALFSPGPTPLARLFPALSQLEAGQVNKAPEGPADSLATTIFLGGSADSLGDPLEQRARAFEALRSLFVGLSQRRPLVLLIDDLQWADKDSLFFLEELVRSEARLLLLCALREGAEVPPWGRRIVLHRLSGEESQTLAGLMPAEGLSSQLAGEAGGHPLFLQELVRYARSSKDLIRGGIRLEDMLRARLSGVSPGARRLLSLLALAGVPLPAKVLGAASAVSFSSFAADLAALRAQQLVRSVGHKGDLLELYHDRIREVAAQNLLAEEERALHAALAEAMIVSGIEERSPEVLVRHLEGGGAPERAFTYALMGAKRAFSALAFEQAASLYRAALRLRPAGTEEGKIREELAQALAMSGQSAEAARAFLSASLGLPPRERLRLESRAAEHLLGSGHLTQGYQVLSSVLRNIGESWPETSSRTVASLLWHRARLRVRGLSFVETNEAQLPEEPLQRLDAYRAICSSLAHIDTIRAADFQARALLLALRLGEPTRLSQALAVEGLFTGVQGTESLSRAEHLFSVSRRLTRGDLHLEGVRLGCEGTVAFSAGRFPEACRLLKTAEETLASAKALPLEVLNFRVSRLYTLRHMGALQELQREGEAALKDALSRENNFAASNLERVLNICWLARGELRTAKSALNRLAWQPPEGAYHSIQWNDLWARAETALYERDTSALWAFAPQFTALSRSLLYRLQIVKVEAAWLQGRLALLAAGSGALALIPNALRAAWLGRYLVRQRLSYSEVWGHLLLAGAALSLQQTGLARASLEKAAARAEESQLRLAASVALYRLGAVIKASEGKRLQERAAARLQEEGVVDPERFAFVVAPGPFVT